MIQLNEISDDESEATVGKPSPVQKDKEVIKKEEVIKYIENCPVPKEIIDLHNQATELNKAATKWNIF